MKKQNLVGTELTFKELDDLMLRKGYESELQYIGDLGRVIEKKYKRPCEHDNTHHGV